MAQSPPRLLSLVAVAGRGARPNRGARTMTAVQLDLFVPEPAPAEDTNIVGLALVMPTPCSRCNGVAATIGAGCGPHRASSLCACGRHLGWISAEAFNFISEIAHRFGRPTEPVQVRFKNGPASGCKRGFRR